MSGTVSDTGASPRTGPPAAQTWRTLGPEPLEWRCWDGDYVVYSPFSGTTQALDILTGEVLKAIMSGQANRADIHAAIAAFLDVDDDAQLAATLRDVLARLEDAGLIEPLD